METVCPKCGNPWNKNEIEFQVCNKCGYENLNEDIEVQFKSFFKSFFIFLWKSFKWPIGILVSLTAVSTIVFFTRELAVKALGPGANQIAVYGYSIFIILLGAAVIFGIVLIINRLSRKK